MWHSVYSEQSKEKLYRKWSERKVDLSTGRKEREIFLEGENRKKSLKKQLLMLTKSPPQLRALRGIKISSPTRTLKKPLVPPERKWKNVIFQSQLQKTQISGIYSILDTYFYGWPLEDVNSMIVSLLEKVFKRKKIKENNRLHAIVKLSYKKYSNSGTKSKNISLVTLTMVS